MATIATESDRFSAPDQNRAAAASGATAQPPPDSLLAEIPVVVHASHRSALPGEANRAQTVREETTTLLILPRGAVLRLSAGVSRGELVVLTNQQNRADMLCRVVLVREQSGSPSYVELEFTQRAPAFWQGSAATEARVRSAAPVTLASAPGTSGSVASAPAPPTFAPLSVPIPEPVPLPVSAAVVERVEFVRPPAAPAPPPHNEIIAPLSAQEAFAAPFSVASSLAPDAIVEASDPARASEADATVWRAEFAPADAESLEREMPLRSARERGSKLKALSHKPAIAVAGALLTIALLFAEGYLLGHHRQPVAANSFSEEPAVRPTFPMQPAVERADERPPLVASAATAGVGATLSPAAVSASIAKDSPATDLGSKASPSAQPQNSASPAASLSAGGSSAGAVAARATPVGKMLAPVAKAPRTAAAGEAPPILTDQATAVAETLLASSSLVQTSSPRSPAPAPAVAAASPAAAAPVAGEFRGPKMISSVPPAYPDLARLQGLNGVVVVDVTIDQTGKVSDAKAVSGPLGLREAALDAVRRWKYQPATTNGHPVAAHQTVDINFTNH